MAPGTNFGGAAAASNYCYNAEVSMIVLGLSLGPFLGSCWWFCCHHWHA